MQQKKQIISLGSDGELVLKLSDGEVRRMPSFDVQNNQAFVYLVIDCSGSMEGDKLKQAKKGSLDFAQTAMARGYAVGLISFNSVAFHLCPPATDLKELRIGVNRLQAEDGTNMTPAIEVAINWLRQKDNALRAMVIVTDGATADPQSALKAAHHAKEIGISILTIGTDDADSHFLSQLASDTDLATKVSSDHLEETISSAAKMLPSGYK